MPVNVTTKKNTSTTSSAASTNKPPLLASNSLLNRVLPQLFLRRSKRAVMLRFTSVLTLIVWTAVLAVNAVALGSEGLQPRTIILAFERPVILVACCAVALAVVALVRRSHVAIFSLFVISIVAGCVSGVNAWMMISMS